MPKTLVTKICNIIERSYDVNGKDFSKNIIVFPVGDVGIQVLNIMKNIYHIEPAYLVDNHKCKYTKNVYDASLFERINTEDYVVLLSSTNWDIYQSLRSILTEFFHENNIIELEGMERNPMVYYKTKIGKYCYGELVRNHRYIESIGSFCSFAEGAEVVPNHEMKYITTHPMLYGGETNDTVESEYEDFKAEEWFFPGVKPKLVSEENIGRAVIGNDVWLGRNVIITNYSKIGNGVIAAAGAVITKDVPDYAVVAGVPARIIKYRYTPEQIEALNKIAWWDWSDEEIRERYDDFYLPIEEFIEKYL